MDNTTDFVKNVDFNVSISKTSVNSSTQNQFGQILMGPYLPIQSGTYNIDVVSTSDFTSFEIKGHY